jgi:formate dehydrogenase maturation protein FdhE
VGHGSDHRGADRLLICGRCAARWRFEPLTCPFCLNADRSRITSFASRDGQYRLYACDVCERYIKAYDARRASRPVMPVVDGVATLPLDAAAIEGIQVSIRPVAAGLSEEPRRLREN